jgi:hypothetical protein
MWEDMRITIIIKVRWPTNKIGASFSHHEGLAVHSRLRHTGVRAVGNEDVDERRPCGYDPCERHDVV